MKWNVIYNGEGIVKKIYPSQILLKPKAALQKSKTHACLVLLDNLMMKNFNVTLEFRVNNQLRQNDPVNPWESLWFFFNYVINPMTKKKETNYFTLKTNGVELGTTSHELQQNFLMTSSFPRLNLGQRHTLQITKRNERILIKVDKYKILDRNYDNLYNHLGQFGFYCEDAEVIIENFRILNLNMIRELAMNDSEYGSQTISTSNLDFNLNADSNSSCKSTKSTFIDTPLSSSPSSQYQRELYPTGSPTEKHTLFDFDESNIDASEHDGLVRDEFICDFEDNNNNNNNTDQSDNKSDYNYNNNPNINDWNTEYGDQ